MKSQYTDFPWCLLNWAEFLKKDNKNYKSYEESRKANLNYGIASVYKKVGKHSIQILTTRI